MRYKIWWLAVMVIAVLILAEGSGAQPPGQQGKKGPPDKFGKKDGKGKKGGGLTEEDVVDRIMSFDKTNSGKVTKDDLPERLQYLIEQGDTNKDGVLDRDEVKALAAKIAKEGPFDGFGGFGGKGPPGKGNGDFFAKGGPQG